MKHYVLVHGAWHGGWCWEPIAAALRAAGHGASVVELPGRGTDTPPHTAITLDDYVRSVASVIGAQPAPVVLVGHSMGGVTITQVAEALPERIALLAAA